MAQVWKEHRSVRLTRALDVVRRSSSDPRAEGRGDGGPACVAADDEGRERTGARRGRPVAAAGSRLGGRASVLPVPPVGGGATPRGGGASRVCAGGVARGARRGAVRRSTAPAGSVTGGRPVDHSGGHAAVVRRSRRRLGRRLHLPDVVAWALAGEPRADDDRMLELLEPYRGQRGRVQRLLEASHISPPAWGPRMEAREIGGLALGPRPNEDPPVFDLHVVDGDRLRGRRPHRLARLEVEHAPVRRTRHGLHRAGDPDDTPSSPAP